MAMTMCKQAFFAAVMLVAAVPVARASETVAPAPRSAELTRCNGFNDRQTAWEAAAAGAEQPLPLRSLVPPVLLPDGSEFKTWEPAEAVEPRRTFFVAQRHPRASDDNPGTEDRPWKTIERAAKVLEPGDRVIVKQGLYREWVRPARGGASPRQMITYQAARGEEVILSGSAPLREKWAASSLVGQTPVAKAWMIDLPGAYFEGYNPFAVTNATANLMTHSAAIKQGWDKPPYTLARGLVFQDGRRLKQVAEYQRLADALGAYWVEPGGRRIHVRPFSDKEPGPAAFEITTSGFAFAPEQAGLGFIRVDGFIVQRVANCYPVPQLGAISTKQGHHWIIENNVVRQVNGLGLDYGRRQTFLPYEVPADTPKLAGVGIIVRRNAFFDCGICSMQGLGLICGLIEDNYVQDAGWHDVEKLWETGGMKLHYLKHALVRRNVIRGTIGAPGLWADHSNANARITQNVIVGVRSASYGGIFLEASYRPNLIDHNIVWDCQPHAFYQHDCGDLTIANNLFGCCTKAPVQMPPPGEKKREVDIETKRMSSVVNNRVAGNVFYGFAERGTTVLEGLGNESDYNVFVNPPGAKPLDLATLRQKTGCEEHSRTFTATLEFSPADWTLRGDLPIMECPRLAPLRADYFGAARRGDRTDAGPFLKISLKPEMVLCEQAARERPR